MGPAEQHYDERSKNMIVVTGQVFVEKDVFHAFFERVKAFCEPALREDGCLFYHMGIEDEEQGIVMAMEGWRDLEALHAHLAQPEIVQLLADFEGKTTTKVTVHEVSASQAL
jgi:quinol monooxygenase YgiN